MWHTIFNLLPSWGIGFGFLILSVGFVILAFKRGFKINGKIFSFNTQSINPEGLALAFEKVLETQFDILKIEFKSRLKEQMSFTEDKLRRIKEKTMEVHRKLLVVNGIPSSQVYQSSQLKIFEKLIYKLLNYMKDAARDRYGEIYELFNNPDNLNDDFNFIRDSFEKYVAGVISVMIQDARDFVSNEWIENDIVSRKDSWESMTPALKEIGEIVQDILTTGIKIQLKYSQIIKQMKKNQKEYIKKVTTL